MTYAPIQDLTVVSNERIALDTWEMTLSGTLPNLVQPGRFLNLQPVGLLLRRPISIANVDERGYTIIYKTVGEGTREFTNLVPGDEISTHGPLGHGFDIRDHRVGQSAIIYGGGVGVPPMYYLARTLVDAGVKVDVRLGFGTADAAFYLDKFAELGTVSVATDDGTLGIHGTIAELDEALVGDADDESRQSGVVYNPDAVYACGPGRMLQYVAQHWADHQNVQLSFEERMACGVGACYGCVKPTTYGQARLCVEGPVLDASEVIW